MADNAVINLEKTEEIVVREAEIIEAELRAMLSEEAKAYKIASEAWQEVKRLIVKLKDVEEKLRFAAGARGPNAALLLTQADQELKSLLYANRGISDVMRKVNGAINLESIDKKIADKVEANLRAAHASLVAEHKRLSGTIATKK